MTIYTSFLISFHVYGPSGCPEVAQMAAEQAKKLLGAREDWDDWYIQLKGMILREIWPYINLEAEIQPLVDPPVLPDIRKITMARASGEP